MRSAIRTHPGRRGGQNEDSTGSNETLGLWFVADGMGGHASGDVASRIVKESLLAHASVPLEKAVREAHRAVASASAAANSNMGSTVVAAHIGRRQAQIVWVGDSRGYLWRGNTLRQVTRDHSFLELLREQEHLSDTQLRGHPNKNLVTQTLGIGAPEPSVVDLPLRRGDWLLLCSDGLNDELEDQEIAAVLSAHPSPETAADQLIMAALAKGGKDNVSVVLVEYDGPNGVSFLQPLRENRWLWLPAIIGAFAALAAAVLWLLARR
ncbi:MAG TPA: protein phosphatase 2C domain-containing protein [Steroidobacteraceae bacterium]|jgi:protein phosphatase